MALNSYGLEEEHPTDVSPWLSGADTIVPTDPQAQVQPGAIWGDQPSAPATATPSNTATGQPGTSSGAPVQAAPYTSQMGTTGFTPIGGADPGQSSGQVPLTSSGPQSYQDLVAAVNAAGKNAHDPAGLALAQDALSRQLMTDLKNDGHTVKWVNNQLQIDGRPYEIASGAITDPTSGFSMGGAGSTTPGAGAGAGGQLGSGWNFGPGTPEAAAQDGIGKGLTGQALADYINQQFPGEALYYPNFKGSGHDVWGLHGTYVSQESDGKYYLTQRGAEGESASSGSSIDFAGLFGGSGAQTPVTASPYATGGNLPAWLTNPQGDPDLQAIAENIPGFSDIYDRLTQIDPNEQATADLVHKILTNPEALSERDVEMLKAANAEEAAVAGQANDQDLQRFGGQTGQDSSPWLAGQRSTNAANTRNAIISSNRGVDIAAANTRQANRLASANVGQAWDEYRQGKSVQAISTAMQGAATKGNIEQAAKQLGMSKAQLSIAYIGQNLNYDINLQALQKRSEEFQSTLALQIAQLKQNDDQFAANFGLALNRFQEEKDQNAWARASQATA